MNLGTLVITISAVAFLLTLVVGTIFKRHKSWVMTFLQNFTGVLFIFSGFVKAVDPLGTAYKMEQYFAEFQATFDASMLSFVAPLFPWLSSYAIAFSVFMIIFEILIGVMLVLGSQRKVTSWAFLILVVFFTFLTGFTYLTGYVPNDVNFFAFGDWGSYNELQMKVTDCGCFGDFLVLKPKISFFKDLVLLVPALYFVFRHKDMHQLFTLRIRNIILGVAGLLLLLYCMRNYVWDIPHTDFRPFKKGVNIAERKALEEEAEANVEVISYTLKNRLSGKYVEIPYEQYLKEFTSYPKTEWEITATEMSEPEVEATKISDFVIYGPDDSDVTAQILENPEPFFLIVCHKIPYEGSEVVEIEYQDSTLVIDTMINGTDTSFVYDYERETKTRKERQYRWKTKYLERFRSKIVPLAEAAAAANVKSVAVFGGADQGMIQQFKRDVGINFTACSADDILLKTIVRSNPGPVLMRGGQILDKWHYKKVPTFEDIRSEHIR